MKMEKLVELLAGDTKALEENLPEYRLSTTNPTCCPDTNPGRRGGKPATNRLNYGTASFLHIFIPSKIYQLTELLRIRSTSHFTNLLHATKKN
jgi:hypothetical protein